MVLTTQHKGESATYILLEGTHTSLHPRSEYHKQLAKMGVDEILDLTAVVYILLNRYGYTVHALNLLYVYNCYTNFTIPHNAAMKYLKEGCMGAFFHNKKDHR